MLVFKKMLPIFLAVGCGSSQKQPYDVKFESAHTVALEGEIMDGLMMTSSSHGGLIESQVEKQLMYSIGQLNGEDGGTDVNRTKISVQSVKQVDDKLFAVSYHAKVFVAWPREREVPKSYDFILPKRVDYKGLESFLQKYGNDQVDENCLDYGAHDVDLGVFWYYYRPKAWGCPLAEDLKNEDVIRIPVRFELSGENSKYKSPEYAKVWEDGRLVVTTIFGMNDIEGGEYDVGLGAYIETYKRLVKLYGRPIHSSIDLDSGELPSLQNPEINLVFDSKFGEIEINMFLVPGIRSVNSKFIERYNHLSRYSDFIAYNGHSGLGANIRALANMGDFVKGQYQIFLVNGCDTFAYVDEALKDAHVAVNPGEPGNKYFDLITNAMPAFFTSLADANIAVIEGLVQQEKSYREILASFDEHQRANVTGEEDNGYWD